MKKPVGESVQNAADHASSTSSMRGNIVPDPLAPRAVPRAGDPLLLAPGRVLMPKEPRQPLPALRTLPLKRLLIEFPPNRIQQRIKLNRIRIRTLSTAPGHRNPFPPPIYRPVLIESDGFHATLRTPLFNNPSPKGHYPILLFRNHQGGIKASLRPRQVRQQQQEQQPHHCHDTPEHDMIPPWFEKKGRAWRESNRPPGEKQGEKTWKKALWIRGLNGKSMLFSLKAFSPLLPFSGDYMIEVCGF